jgi:hypothetical protein
MTVGPWDWQDRDADRLRQQGREELARLDEARVRHLGLLSTLMPQLWSTDLNQCARDLGAEW